MSGIIVNNERLDAVLNVAACEHGCWMCPMDLRKKCDADSGATSCHDMLLEYLIEDVSGEISEWIPITYDDEGKINCELPQDDQDIIVSGISKHGVKWVDRDCFCYNGNEVYLDSGTDWDVATAWMPFPDPYEGEKDED